MPNSKGSFRMPAPSGIFLLLVALCYGGRLCTKNNKMGSSVTCIKKVVEKLTFIASIIFSTGWRANPSGFKTRYSATFCSKFSQSKNPFVVVGRSLDLACRPAATLINQFLPIMVFQHLIKTSTYKENHQNMIQQQEHNLVVMWQEVYSYDFVNWE